MKRKISIILFITLLILCSCEKKENKKIDQVNITENQKKEAEKYNNYVLLYNHLLQIDEYIGYYFDVAGATEKMKKLEGKINIPSINQSILDGTKENIGKNPEMKELDSAARDLVPLLSEMKTLTDQMTEYYKDGNYYKNKYLRIEMHLKFLEITKKYRTFSKKFKDAFDKKSKEQKNRAAEKIKKEGKLIEYDLITFIDSCEAILDEIQKEKISAENFTNADLLKKENYHSSDFTSFILYTSRFKETVKKFISRIEKKEGVNPKLLQNNPSLKNESGTPENIFYEYNELIREYNKLSN